MLGIRGKAKKASKDDSPAKEDPLTKQNTSKRSTKKTKRRISLNCLNNRVKDDQSEVHMVHIDHFKSKSAPSTDAASGPPKTIKISNMMTPDMLEALGIEEEMRYRHIVREEKIKGLMSGSAQRRTRRSDIIDSNNSVSTSSTCSSHDSYGALPIDPFLLDSCNLYENCNNQDDWNLLQAQIDNKTLIQYYRDNSLAGCTPMTCAGVALSMPVACGLLCVDNVLDTDLFETATKANEASADDKPEVLTIKDKKRTERKSKTITSPVASL